MDLIEAQLRLGRARGVTTADIQQLLVTRRMPLPQPALVWLCEHSSAVRAALLRVDGHQIESDRRWVECQGITLLDITSERYPPQLLTTPQAPRLLYCQGDIEALRSPQLAIVGSRQPTTLGKLIADEFASQLVLAGVAITSGLALGIDDAAHQGALRAGARTIAVLGTSLDRIYPREHQALAERIAASGALISELPPAAPHRRWHFPQRNRIISGMSLAVLVVEAGLASGSLTTAKYARRQSRPVFAIPGSTRNAMARGCHQLIRSGAVLVETPMQILDELKISSPKQSLRSLPAASLRCRPTAGGLDKASEILLDAVGFEPTSLDALVERTGLPSQSVASMLLILELEGAVGQQTDGRYMRL
jgi:DNA processing protein